VRRWGTGRTHGVDISGRCRRCDLPPDTVSNDVRNREQPELEAALRASVPPFVEPLMGWTGGDDTLAQVEMTFRSAQAAIAYARRQGVDFVLRQPADRHASTLKLDERGRRMKVPEPEFVVEGASQATAAESLAEDDHARANVTSGYDRPSEVARDPKLSVERKRNLLRQWALDAYRTEVATMDGMPPSASQLDEAIDALIDLDGGTASMSKRSTIRSATAGDRAQAA
jgi:ETC complex I subunit conserved region